MLEDFNGIENADYRFGGQKAVKYRCVSPDVWKDIDIGTRVMCSFDSRQRVSYMSPVKKGVTAFFLPKVPPEVAPPGVPPR